MRDIEDMDRPELEEYAKSLERKLEAVSKRLESAGLSDEERDAISSIEGYVERSGSSQESADQLDETTEYDNRD